FLVFAFFLRFSCFMFVFFFSSRRRHTRSKRDWSSDVCSSDLNPSHLHQLTADEVWYYHAGHSLTIHTISKSGEYEAIKLGTDVENGEVLQALVPKGTIFGSSVENEGEYALVSCMVAPGFEFDDFKLFTQDELIERFPQHEDIIRRYALK